MLINKTTSAAVASAVALLASAHGQGTFQNLDFEAARLIPIDNDHPWFIATSNALPGWTAEYGGRPLSAVPYFAGGVGPVVLSGLYGSSIDGSFSVGLAAIAYETASISQTGLVPVDARSLQFKVSYSGAFASRSTDIVSLDGQNLSLVALSSGREFTLFGADISRFAGQTETLNFYSLASDPQDSPVYALDDIQFSPQIVPEPSVFALAAAAGSLLLCRRFGGRSGQLRQAGRHGRLVGCGP